MSKSATRDNDPSVLLDPHQPQWDVLRHVAKCSPTHNIALLDMRNECAGWSLRIQRPVVSGDAIIHIPWEHILDSAKAVNFIVALRRVLQMDTTPTPTSPSTSSPTTSTTAQRGAIQLVDYLEKEAPQEVQMAAALLAAQQVVLNPHPVLDGVADVAAISPLLRDAVETIKQFCTHFNWVHDVVQDCGDLGVPLVWEALFHNVVNASSSMLHCDANLHQRVQDDFKHLSEHRLRIEALWSGLSLPRTLFSNDTTSLFGTPIQFCRYVAWIRSRWVCFLTPTVSRAKHTTMESYALCPLIEKINHHPNSPLCPTIEVGEYVALRMDAHHASDAPNQLDVAGDELFISYGAQPNLHLLERYGFLFEPNQADVITINLPLIAQSTLDRWCIAADSVRLQWSFRPSQHGGGNSSATGGASKDRKITVPLVVIFSIVVSCLDELVRNEQLEPPAMAACEADDKSDGDNGFHLGCLGEGNSDDSDEDGSSWFYDDDRIRRFLKKQSIQVQQRRVVPSASASVMLVDNVDTNDDKSSLVSMACDILRGLVERDVTKPAEQLLARSLDWELQASTKEVALLLRECSSSRYWAERYAQMRRAAGVQLLCAIDVASALQL